MQPDAWRDLLLNLKLQLLALPSLLRWGVLAFAGIVVLREGITAGWNIYQARKAAALPRATRPPENGVPSAGVPTEPAALPAPDPFAPDFRQPELQDAEPRTPAGGTAR